MLNKIRCYLFGHNFLKSVKNTDSLEKCKRCGAEGKILYDSLERCMKSNLRFKPKVSSWDF